MQLHNLGAILEPINPGRGHTGILLACSICATAFRGFGVAVKERPSTGVSPTGYCKTELKKEKIIIMASTSNRTNRRGFASMDYEKQREIARMGGRAAHEKGTAHEFTPEEAREAGRKGGEAVSRNRD